MVHYMFVNYYKYMLFFSSLHPLQKTTLTHWMTTAPLSASLPPCLSPSAPSLMCLHPPRQYPTCRHLFLMPVGHRCRLEWVGSALRGPKGPAALGLGCGTLLFVPTLRMASWEQSTAAQLPSSPRSAVAGQQTAGCQLVWQQRRRYSSWYVLQFFLSWDGINTDHQI